MFKMPVFAQTTLKSTNRISINHWVRQTVPNFQILTTHNAQHYYSLLNSDSGFKQDNDMPDSDGVAWWCSG